MMGMVFSLGGKQKYILPVDSIREVVVSPNLARIPGAHKAVSGMFHLRGEVIAVIDTPSIIEMNVPKEVAASKIIICEVGDDVFGLAIHDAYSVQVFDDSSMESSSQGGLFVSNLWIEREDQNGSEKTIYIGLNPQSFNSYISGAK